MTGGVTRCFFEVLIFCANDDSLVAFQKGFLVGSINYDGCRFIFHQFNHQLQVNLGLFELLARSTVSDEGPKRRPKILCHYRPVGRVSRGFFLRFRYFMLFAAV